MSSIYPVSVKLGSKAGVIVVPDAKRLGRSASSSGTQSAYGISEGFLLKASRAQGVYNVYVLDIPGFIMLKGDTATGTTSPNPSVSGPQRDDLTAGAIGIDRQVVSQAGQGNKYVPPPVPDPSKLPNYTTHRDVWAMHEWQGTLFSNGGMLLPFTMPLGSGFYPMDSFLGFPRNNVVTITAQFTNFKYSALAQAVTARKQNVLSQSAFCLSEAQLPSGWSFFPRRLVSESAYQGSDGFRFANNAQVLQYGFTWTPQDEDADPVPSARYCVAAQITNQDLTLYKASSGDYSPDYYDRLGQSALGVFFASLDQAAYNADSPAQMYATLDDQFMVTVPDLPAYLQPAPELLVSYDPDTGSGMDIKRTGGFFAPRALRCTEGFVTFSVYRCSQQEPGSLVGNINVTALVTVPPDRAPIILKADKSNWDSEGPTPDLPGFDPTHSTWPWILGGFTVPRTDANGNVTRTAYALVWEQWSNTQSQAFDRARGEWSVYSFESGAPVRTVLAEDGASASTIASIMAYGDNIKAFPIILNSNNVLFEDYKSKDYSSFCYAGDDTAVTPAIDKPFPVDDATAHDVRCGFVDLQTGVIQLRGVIGTRVHGYERFYITVAQPYSRADEDTGKAAIQPVLIASSYDSRTEIPGAKGKTWLSVDGGYTWNTYFTDSGADIGAYYVGNELWDYDPSKLFTIL